MFAAQLNVAHHTQRNGWCTSGHTITHTPHNTGHPHHATSTFICLYVCSVHKIFHRVRAQCDDDLSSYLSCQVSTHSAAYFACIGSYMDVMFAELCIIECMHTYDVCLLVPSMLWRTSRRKAARARTFDTDPFNRVCMANKHRQSQTQ